MASTREALGDALRPNSGNEMVGKLPTDTTGRSKQRSATEGAKEGHKEDRNTKLLGEVEALRARLARRDETISKLQTQAKHHTSSRDLQSKVNDLVSRHQASKEEHRLALEKLAAKSANLEKEAESHRSKEASLVSKLADTRAKFALSEAEHSKTRQELSRRPLPTSGPSVDERLTWRKEKASNENEIKKLEREVSRWMKRCEDLQEDSQKYVGMEGENERLKYGAAIIAEQYAELFENFRDVQEVTREREVGSTMNVQRMEGELEEARQVNNEILEERDGMAHRLELAQRHVETLKESLHFVLASKREIQQFSQSSPPLESQVTPLDPIVSPEEVQTILDLSLAHSNLCQAALTNADEHILTLTTTIIELESSARKAEQSLSSVRTSLAGLEAEHEVLRAEHAPCGATMSQLRFELDQANQVADNRGDEINEVRLRLCKADERSERHADLLKKANDSLSRAKFAQDALEEEVEHLRTKFLEAAGFEEQYYELLERQEILECREAVAIEQAERVAMENAELMGHTDGSSRIGYVDGVRREMAMCRQELASTRHHLNNANSRIATLENEISAYKSISSEAAASNVRTRVVRRQPEGGRLTTSVSASGPRRLSVSGPGGARRFV